MIALGSGGRSASARSKSWRSASSRCVARSAFSSLLSYQYDSNSVGNPYPKTVILYNIPRKVARDKVLDYFGKLGRITSCVLKPQKQLLSLESSSNPPASINSASLTFDSGNSARSAVLLKRILKRKPSSSFANCKCEFDENGRQTKSFSLTLSNSKEIY